MTTTHLEAEPHFTFDMNEFPSKYSYRAEPKNCGF